MLNLTLMTVIIYTGNKVESNRGREENQPAGYFFFSPAMKFYAKSSVNLIARLAILHPKTTFFIKVFSFVFLVPEKHIIFAKVQRRIKSKIRLSYRLSFKLLVVNQSNMLHRQIICLSITYQTSKSNISQISNFQLHFLIKLFLI